LGDVFGDVFFASNTDSILLNEQPYLQKMHDTFNDDVDVLLLVVHKDNAHGYVGGGDFSIDSDGYITRDTCGDYVFCGVQVLRKSAFDATPYGAFSLNILYDMAIKNNRAKAVVYNDDWYHISTPVDVEKTTDIFQRIL
jgi:MurNAc alpha-1-phosphate uridylyltransferase